MDNRRKHHRIKFDGPVELDFLQKGPAHCKIKNLSLTGMCVAGDFRERQDVNCIINLDHQVESEKIHLQACGRVIWRNDEEVGLKFISMTFDGYMSLLAALVNEAEEPVIILKEFPKTCPFEISCM